MRSTLNTRLLLLPLLASGALAQGAAEIRARYSDWDQRDSEGRWVLFEEAVLQNPQENATWIQVFAAEEAWEDLAWVALVRDDVGSPAANALVQNDAPQWLAVETWRLDRVDSHNSGSARTSLTSRADLFLAWAEAHADELTGTARQFVGELETAGHAADPGADVARYQPPLRVDEHLRVLRDAAAAEPFGQRLRAIEGAVYHHQVRRAIAALRVLRAVGPDVVDGLVLAALGAEPSIAREACLAFGHLPSRDVPMDVLLALAEDTDRDATVRDAAFLAATYGPRIPVYVTLHEVVRDPGHPSWEAALSRLAERGDGFTLRWLADLDTGFLSSTRRLQFELTLETVRALAAAQLSADVWQSDQGRVAATLLERAAYADLEGSPVAGALVEWTIEFLRGLPAPDPVPVLPGDPDYDVPSDLADRFAPGEFEARAAALRERVTR